MATSDLFDVIKVVLLLAILLSLGGLVMVNFGFDARAVYGCLLNRVNLDRYMSRYFGHVIYLPELTVDSRSSAITTMLSHRLGIVLTPGDFSQINVVHTRAGLRLHLRCSHQSRWFYGHTVLVVTSDSVIQTHTVIQNIELTGLDLPE